MYPKYVFFLIALEQMLPTLRSLLNKQATLSEQGGIFLKNKKKKKKNKKSKKSA